MSDIRFIHTADWQIGKTFHYLNEKARERMYDDRLEVIEKIANYANSQNVHFSIVAGDIFETADVRQELINAVCKKLALFNNPVLLLAGNHEFSNFECILRAPHFLRNKPERAIVLEPGANQIPGIEIPNFEIVAAPLKSKEDDEDQVASQLKNLSADGKVRILIGHGGVDKVAYGDSKSMISQDGMESAVLARKVHYIALGDRHTPLSVGSTGRVWYSGAPEPTNFREPKELQRFILDVKLSGNGEEISVEKTAVGRWTFATLGEASNQISVSSVEELRAKIAKELADCDPRRTAIKYYMSATLPIPDIEKMERAIAGLHENDYAGFIEGERSIGLAPLIESEAEVATRYGLDGYLLETFRELNAEGAEDSEEGKVARRAMLKMLGMLEAVK